MMKYIRPSRAASPHEHYYGLCDRSVTCHGVRARETLPEEAARDSSKPLDRMDLVLRWSGIERHATGTSTEMQRYARVLAEHNQRSSRANLVGRAGRHLPASRSTGVVYSYPLWVYAIERMNGRS